MNVNLKPELETLIVAEVKAGRSSEEIDRMICDGLDDIDRGDMIEGEEAFRQLRALSAERRQLRR
jgi:hypothetical protein